VFHPERLAEISHAKAGKRIFVGSMADMFHEQVNIRGPELADVFRAVAYSEATCLFLTKRARRMKDAVQFLYGTSTEEFRLNLTCQDEPPLKNLWLGVSVELQKYATRIERLRETPAALRFVSVEPMLGRINLRPFLPGVSWVICGPETGMKPRPMEISWARDLRDQCQKAGVAFFYKPQTAPEDLRIQEFPV
jgi:protein gp37